MNRTLKSALIGSVSSIALATAAHAENFNIPGGDLETALNAFASQTGVALILSDTAVRGAHTKGAHGDLSANVALSHILEGTGFTTHITASGAVGVVREKAKAKRDERSESAAPVELAATQHAAASVETVVVTSSKIKGDIQTVPIAITALSQEQLTSRQIAGGPDLVKEVPNLTFSKTNFSGYNIQIRGIGTQAISVTTDPAVAVAFNDTPFIRNHFFEQEFFDVSQVEVLRGPQGTLYGRNATAGVVNVVSAKPTDQFEAMLSADWGNYSNRRYEGMVNIPIVDDRLDLRVAGEWTKRDGYSFNTLNNQPIDGRDLWSSRVTIGWKPVENVQAYLVWEHFQEGDDRLRSGKQLCKTAIPPASVNGVSVGTGGSTFAPADYLSQGCQASSLYSADAFQVPYGPSLPYYSGLTDAFPVIHGNFDVYANTTQSRNLRDIESQINPSYKARNDTIELNADYRITPTLTFTSQTGYNNDFLFSTEDFNRFDTAPGVFIGTANQGPGTGLPSGSILPDPNGLGICEGTAVGSCSGLNLGAACTAGGPSNYNCSPDGIFCDPQLGCSDRLLAQDLSEEKSWQASQEFRLASNFSGPFNFSVGGNYLHYETVENYYVFINTLTLFSLRNGDAVGTYVPGVTDESCCIPGGFRYPNPSTPSEVLQFAKYIDPNPITSLNGQGHNYFRSENPYVLNSYAMFGEAYYNITPDIKLTGGLRWTVDQKHFIDIPSEVLLNGYGYPATNVVDQSWHEFTGRSVLNWTPKLDFTDQTLVYGSYAHGYKAGGANPPGALFSITNEVNASVLTVNPIHPLIFKPEFIDAFELGSKNTALDGSLTLNGDVFYYIYKGYQISRIVDRTAINDNFNAHVRGAELETTWQAAPGLKFSFAGGYEDATLDKGDQSVDLIDRTAGNSNWIVVRPFVTEASNCILPTYVVAEMLPGHGFSGDLMSQACDNAYTAHFDPVTNEPYGQVAVPGYPGFDPLAGTSGDPYTGQNTFNGVDYGPAPNNGQGFNKNLSGNQLPNAPHFTVSLSGDYTMPVSANWAATFHSDFYWQSQSWARVFNDRPYDKLRGYSNVNLALILTDVTGWQVMGYVKNVFDTTAITGDFLNSDDTGLTTNVFLTDPRLYGLRITKNFDAGDLPGGSFDLFSDTHGARPLLWIELGGALDRIESPQQAFNPYWLSSVTIPAQQKALDVQSAPAYGIEEDAKLSYQPDDSDWIMAASVRYGRSQTNRHSHQQTKNAEVPVHFTVQAPPPFHNKYYNYDFYPSQRVKFADGQSGQSEHHLIVDFQAGKDVGLGMFGQKGTSVVSGGVRIAQLNSRSNATLRALPDLQYPTAPIYSKYARNEFKNSSVNFHAFGASEEAERSFHAVGPAISWDASMPVAGSDDAGSISFDWGLDAAVLFGRQKAQGRHQTNAQTYHMTQWKTRDTIGGVANGRFDNNYAGSCGYYHNRDCYAYTAHATNSKAIPGSFNRSRNVTVPNLGGYAGVSVHYSNAKISLGYRADEFFNAMDGGQDTAKKYDRGFYGPYLNLSIGFGG